MEFFCGNILRLALVRGMRFWPNNNFKVFTNLNQKITQLISCNATKYTVKPWSSEQNIFF